MPAPVWPFWCPGYLWGHWFTSSGVLTPSALSDGLIIKEVSSKHLARQRSPACEHLGTEDPRRGCLLPTLGWAWGGASLLRAQSPLPIPGPTPKCLVLLLPVVWEDIPASSSPLCWAQHWRPFHALLVFTDWFSRVLRCTKDFLKRNLLFFKKKFSEV